MSKEISAFTKTDNRLRPKNWSPVISIHVYDNLGIMRYVGFRKIKIKVSTSNPVNLRRINATQMNWILH